MRTSIAMSGSLPPALGLRVCVAGLLVGLLACTPQQDTARSDAAQRGRSATAPDAANARKPASTAASPERPLPFPEHATVTLAEWLEALQAELPAIAASDTVRTQFDRLRAKHDLPDDERLYADFVRVRTAFEATRAGGYWGLEWRVTDRQPQSDHVWTQWRTLQTDGTQLPPTTAIAECDELSALFAFVARGLGLSRQSRVGLLWPTSNHTVAVWAFDLPFATHADTAGDAGRNHRREIRIVVPTSQIFLDSAEGLDTDGFDPWVQARVFDYTRRDAPADLRMPAALARAFVQAVRMHGATSAGELQSLRNRRAYAQRQANARAR